MVDASEHQLVKLSELKDGDIIVSDGSFICVGVGDRVVHKAEDDQLYVKCEMGDHYLYTFTHWETGHLFGFNKKTQGAV